MTDTPAAIPPATTYFRIILTENGDTETICWQILQVSSKNAVLVVTPGGNLWLPPGALQPRRFDLYEIQQLIEEIRRLTVNGNEAMTPVWKAGNSYSEKTHKFKFNFRKPGTHYHDKDLYYIKSRVCQLPLSQVRQIDGQWLAPAWLVKRHLHKDESLDKTVWPGLQAVTEEISAAAQRIRARRAVLKAESRAREAAELKRIEMQRQQREAEKAELMRQVNEDGEAALKFCRRTLTLSALRVAGIHMRYWPTWPPTPDFYSLQPIVELINHVKNQPEYLAWKAKVRR